MLPACLTPMQSRPSAFRVSGLRPALQMAIVYALQQSLIDRKIAVEELFDKTGRAL